MSLLDKIKNAITDDDNDFEEYYDDDAVEFDRRESRRERTIEYPSFEEEPKEKPRRAKSDKVVNIHTTAQLQVVLKSPDRFEEAVSIADNLNEKRTVVLNLENTDRDIARRTLDFLSGVAYANNGQIKRVAKSTYIITPYNVDVMGDIIDELESTGMFM